MYTTKDYTHLLGLKGFSDEALSTHWTLYEGYVKNTNSILEKLVSKESAVDLIARSELQRRLGWEYNGMLLHEIYFESLSKDAKSLNLESTLAQAITHDFGSYKNWLLDFKRLTQMRGIGWVALAKDAHGQLHNLWFEEHNTGHFANSQIIFCLDLLEHSFLIDYGIKKGEYVDAFFQVLNFGICEERFNSSK